MKKIIIIIIFIIIVLFGLYKITSKPNTSITSTNIANPDLVLYWGQGCPHCEKVKDYIKANNIDQKLKINQKEVYSDKQNQAELTDTVTKFCPEIDIKQGIGVPLAFDSKNNKCFQGDQPIIDFINQKTGIKQ